MIPTILRSSIVAAGVFTLAGFAHAETAKPAEWGTFRGPNHDGTGPALKSVKDWKQVKLQKLWKQDTPNGFSSFSVAGGKVYTIVTREVDG
ncbi:MAG: outer membrane protein assembly factor BamB, contains PQQ-like beta-propeller repeat, partial [Verrucomicrobiaceae bacterium]|nr:outer membrane protein assembly factor BamB, contains PQQ-like beta-propeller repeat [Verrucomicrobiaceae bacterium]